VLLPKHDIISMMSFLHSLSLNSENGLLPKCGIGLVMPFSHSFSLDIILTERKKVPMDARKQVLVSSNNFPSTTNSTMGDLVARYFGFMILAKVEIPIEHRLLVGNSVLVRDLVIDILVLVGSTLVSVLDPMVEILVLVGSSLFSVQILIVVKSWFSIPSHGFWILVMSIENETFLPLCLFKVVVWNPILVFMMSLPFSTIDSNPLRILKK